MYVFIILRRGLKSVQASSITRGASLLIIPASVKVPVDQPGGQTYSQRAQNISISHNTKRLFFHQNWKTIMSENGRR